VQYGLRGEESKGLIESSPIPVKKIRSRSQTAHTPGEVCTSSGYYDAYYLKAQKVRTKIKGDFIKAFKDCDCIVTPTSPTPAFRIGEKIDDPLSMYLSDIYTIPANLAGIPGISVPCGFTSAGLPVGLQILGNYFSESTLIRAAYTYEQAAGYYLREPALLKRVPMNI
jgi:aspartyl-tRNA(Asn)/glutamyl-tRNA(Gln) amidotransferase subunit A